LGQLVQVVEGILIFEGVDEYVYQKIYDFALPEQFLILFYWKTFALEGITRLSLHQKEYQVGQKRLEFLNVR
jgi:hypothetical protein